MHVDAFLRKVYVPAVFLAALAMFVVFAADHEHPPSDYLVALVIGIVALGLPLVYAVARPRKR